MNQLSMHQVTAVAFEPVQYLSAGRYGQDSYYVRLKITQTLPYSTETVSTELILHSDKPLRLGIPN